MTSDSELLRRYAEIRDEAAFAEIVNRHTNLVYTAARRLTNGDSHFAQDVSQKVFTDLANKAGRLSQHASLVGWLHTATRNAASVTVRSERRRQTREREASAMEHQATTTEADWMQLEPLLDEAVGQLRTADREAVLLRYFQGKSHREVAMELGWNEAAARKRVERALEQLRIHFTRCGVTVSSVVLATSMTANSVQAAPIGTVKKITASSLVGATGTIGDNLMMTLFSMSTKAKAIIAIAVLAVICIALVTVLHNPISTTIQVATAQPKTLVAKVAQVAAPTAPPAPQSSSAVQAMTDNLQKQLANQPIKTDPQADLKTAIPDFVRLERAGDFVAVYQNYTPPGLVDPERIRAAQMVLQRIAKDRATNPKSDRLIQEQHDATMHAYEDLESQVPTYNAAGDEATYMFSPALAGIQTPTGSQPYPMTFIKIDGRWYLKPPDQGANLVFGGPGG